jgi:hypothetical protein
MSVIINDFEVVPDQEQTAAPATNGSAAAAASDAGQLKPMDIEDILRRSEARKKRMRAH